MRVAIRDYQPIVKADLEFVEGLNLITGPNSSGKTTIMRAIRSAILNPPQAKRHIRYGCRAAQVAIKLDKDSPVVQWTRTEDQAIYKVHGERFDKCGRTKLHGLDHNFGIKVDRNNKIVGMSTEWDILFPFGYTPSELFTIFEDVISITDSSGVLKQIRDDELSIRRRLEVSGDKIVVEQGVLDKIVEGNPWKMEEEFDVLFGSLLREDENLNQIKPDFDEARNIASFILVCREINPLDLPDYGDLLELRNDLLEAEDATRFLETLEQVRPVDVDLGEIDKLVKA